MAASIEVTFDGRSRLLESAGNAGFYLTSTEEGIVRPGHRVEFETGTNVDIPEGFAMLVVPNPGLGAETGVTLSDSVTVIQPGYHAGITVSLTNHGEKTLSVNVGSAIALAIVVKLPDVEFVTNNGPERKSDDGSAPVTNEPSPGNPRMETRSHPKYLSILTRRDPVVVFEGKGPDTRMVGKYRNTYVALVDIANKGGRTGASMDNINAMRSCAMRIKKLIKSRSAGTVYGYRWGESKDIDGVITAKDLSRIPDFLIAKRKPYEKR